MAASSAAVSVRWATAEEATKVTVEVLLGLKGWASLLACTLAAVVGRNCELEDFSTLASDGRQIMSSTVTTIQPPMMSQRNRTVNRPRAANKRVILQGSSVAPLGPGAPTTSGWGTWLFRDVARA
jgi:hypothetical protein